MTHWSTSATAIAYTPVYARSSTAWTRPWAVPPDRPVRVVAHCLGGVVAFAMATSAEPPRILSW
ncbi:hypothetical protein [Streptomyces sp. NPDC085540]|uniref:hypothetical protein n=1 Tax=Streptomyces sp. NPDC085540 TaxID=3365730 RepID=UPI0037D52B19